MLCLKKFLLFFTVGQLLLTYTLTRDHLTKIIGWSLESQLVNIITQRKRVKSEQFFFRCRLELGTYSVFFKCKITVVYLHYSFSKRGKLLTLEVHGYLGLIVHKDAWSMRPFFRLVLNPDSVF